MTEYVDCPSCNGTKTEFPDCDVCDGRGWIYGPSLSDAGTMLCPECEGEPCSDCEGEGVVKLISPEYAARNIIAYLNKGDMKPSVSWRDVSEIARIIRRCCR